MGAGDLMRRLDRRALPPVARALHRLGRGAARMRLLVVAAVLAAAAVVVAAMWAGEREPTSDPTAGQVVRVGVVEGQSIPAYVQASRSELHALLASAPPGPTPEQTYALVTLGGYLAPDRLTPVLGGVAVATVYARVPLPETQTEFVKIPAFRVPGDVTAGMIEVARRKTAEAAEYQRLAAQLTGDGERERRLRTVYTSGAQVAAAEATAYQEHCSCVYAAVVRASPAALERIAGRPEVRAVDPAPEVRRLDRAVFLPPLPEQTGVVKPPPDSRLNPSPAPSAPAQSGPAPLPPGSVPSDAPASRPVPSSLPDPVSPSPGSAPVTSAPAAA